MTLVDAGTCPRTLHVVSPKSLLCFLLYNHVYKVLSISFHFQCLFRKLSHVCKMSIKSDNLGPKPSVCDGSMFKSNKNQVRVLARP